MSQHVVVVPYNPQWPALYEQEAQAIGQSLGENLTAIHHIGSTSVPGLAAKPIIDIMPVVRDLAQVDACSARFEALGYEVMGELASPAAAISARAAMSAPTRSTFFSRTTAPTSTATWRCAIICAATPPTPRLTAS